MEYSYDGHPNWKVLLSEVSCSPLRRSQQSSLNPELKPSLSSIPTGWTQLEDVWDLLELSLTRDLWPLMSWGACPKTQNHSQLLSVCWTVLSKNHEWKGKSRGCSPGTEDQEQSLLWVAKFQLNLKQEQDFFLKNFSKKDLLSTM